MGMNTAMLEGRWWHHANDVPPKVGLKCEDESRAKQSEADACNINKIMERYSKTGVMPQSARELFFADVSEMTDFKTTLEHVDNANRYFMSLPAKVRAEFDNDPATFLDVISDPANKEKLVEMGLLEGEPVVAAQPAADAGGDPPAE